MQNIAELAGVSLTTVSHALSGNRPVSPRTLARINAIIDRFGYVPASAARSLKSGRSMMIGLVVPDISHLYFGHIAKGVEEVANDHDYGMIFCSSSYSDPLREKRYFNLLRNRSIDGMIYNAGDKVDEPDELHTLVDSFPIVLIDERIPSLDSLPTITSDNYEGGRLAGQYLHGIGHRRAVVIAGVPELASTKDRVRGFKESFPSALVLYGDFSQETGAAAVSDLFANRVPFTCVMAGNDDIAAGTIRALERSGMRVPQDVSVVGFDDTSLASMMSPRLTTIKQPSLEMGRRSAETLIASLIGGHPLRPGLTELPVELIVRDSTAPVSPAPAGETGGAA